MGNSLSWLWILIIVAIILLIFLLNTDSDNSELPTVRRPSRNRRLVSSSVEAEDQDILFSWQYDMNNSPNTNVNNIKFELEMWYPGSDTGQAPDEKVTIPSNGYVSGYPKEISTNVYLYEWYYTETTSNGTYYYQIYAYITTHDGSNLPSDLSPNPPGSFTVLKCDPLDCNPGVTYCDAPDCKSCACQCGSGNEPNPTCNTCTRCDFVPNLLYSTDPISQAVYYGFCRYADNVSLCMEESSKRYQSDGLMGIFPSNLPGSSCLIESPTNSTSLVCSAQCPPFSARVKSYDGKTSYASCISPYSSVDSRTRYNPYNIQPVDFSDWTSSTNAYKNGFIWVIDGDSTKCVVPLRKNKPSNQTHSIFVKRHVHSGHPYLIWKTRYSDKSGDNQTPYNFFTGGKGDGYPLFRIYHPATRTVISNDDVHAPNSGKCANNHMELKRVTNPDTDSFYCKPTGDNASDEKCYLFSMWNQCGYIDSSEEGSADLDNIGDPISTCYKVLNMPVKNSKHREMIVESPSSWMGYGNPDTCLQGTAQEYKAIAVSGIIAGSSRFTFDFYANANLSWPPTSTATPWVQPLQYCIPTSPGTETYYYANMYMYTFANTDSSDPSSFTTVGWYNLFSNFTEAVSNYHISAPDDLSDKTELKMRYISDNNFTMTYYKDSIEQYFFCVGFEYINSSDYTNFDDNVNVYEATLNFSSPPPIINVTSTGLLRTSKNGITYYLCAYSKGSIQILLWINLDGNFAFDESITIRCPMWAVYYSS